jgi:Outer membrane protein beta-barrel domain
MQIKKQIKSSRIVALLLTFMLMSVGVNAQFSVGAKGGLNFCRWLGIKDYYNSDFRSLPRIKINSSAGLVFQYDLGGSLSLQAELLYLQKGVSYKGKGEVTYFLSSPEKEKVVATYRMTLDYIEIPLLLQWKKIQGEKFGLFLTGGSSLGYGLSTYQQSTATVRGFTSRYTRNYSFSDQGLRKLDFSAVLGVGLSYHHSCFGDLFMELRAMHSLRNVNADEGEQRLYNQGLGYTVGFVKRLRRG